jgi:hypothetical protein
MAIVSPSPIIAESGQDLVVTVSLSPAESIVGWTVEAKLREYNGGPVIATGSVLPTDTANGIWEITWAAADLTVEPGSYVWEFTRTNSGAVYPIVEPSAFIIRPSSASAYPSLTSLSELASNMRLGTISDTDAKQYIQLIMAAESFVRRVCNRQFTYNAAYVEYLDSNQTDAVLLRERPVHSVTSVYLDAKGYSGQAPNAFGPESLLTAGVDYFLEIDNSFGTLANAGKLKRIGRSWPLVNWMPIGCLAPRPTPIAGCIKVTYAGGYKLIPNDLKLAIWQIVADRKQAALWGSSFQSESHQGYSYSLGSPDQEILKIGSVRSILNSYGLPAVGVW